MQIEITPKRLKTMARRLRDQLGLDDTQGRRVLDALAQGLGYKSHGALKATIAAEAPATGPTGPKSQRWPAALRTIVQAHPAPWSIRRDPDTRSDYVADAGGVPVRGLDRLTGLDEPGALRRFVDGLNRAIECDRIHAAGCTIDDALARLRDAGLVVIAVDAHDIASYLAVDSTEDGEPGDLELQRSGAWFAEPDNRARLESRLAARVHSALEDVADTIPSTPIVGYQIADPERGAVASETASLPWQLTPYDLLAGEAVATARAWAESAGYTLQPIRAGDIQEPEFIDWLPPAAA